MYYLLIRNKFGTGIKKVRGTTPSLKSNQNNSNYVRIILILQIYSIILDYLIFP